MAPHTVLADHSNGEELSDYEKMGRDLWRNMKLHADYLKMEGSVMPSLSPSYLEGVGSNGEMGEAARLRVVELAQRILATAMDPTINLLTSSLQFHFCSCLKVAVDLNIAEHIPKHSQVSVTDLAEATGAEAKLLVRIMRVLTTKFVFAEPKTGFYCHTSISWTMALAEQKALFKHRLEDGFRSSSRQADALRLNGYREPLVGDNCGFNLAFGSKGRFWDYITKTDPVRGENFHHAMKAVNINNSDMIPALYPFDRLAESGGLIVDVGGGLGQVGRKILVHYPKSELRWVVQDRFAFVNPVADDNTVNNSQQDQNQSNDDILQCHNFFDPQPIKGAAAYFFRHIFHDWPDSACVEILRQIVPAMNKEHSRILICDQVMHEEEPSIPSILYDIDMMCMFGGKERKLSEWKALLSETDERLHITDLRKSPTSATTIIEVRLQ